MTDESEEACLVNTKSPLNGGMPYTDGLNAASTVTTVASTIHSIQTSQQAHSTTIHHSTNTTTNNPYDINDDIILSQFHADAIKQVSNIVAITYSSRTSCFYHILLIN